MTTLKEFLNEKYPTKEDKEKLKEIIINHGILEITNQDGESHTLTEKEVKELDGKELNLSEYSNLEKIIIDGDYLKSELTSLDISNCSKLIKLKCSYNKLTNLTITNCPNLKEIDCYNNQLTNLELNNLPVLTELACSDNQLTNLNFLTNCGESLTYLNIRSNKLTGDLTPFSQLVNCETLSLSNNSFTGSLAPLQNLSKLKMLWINNTQINSGLEYLPESLEWFYCEGTNLATELKVYGRPNIGNYFSLLQLWKQTHFQLIQNQPTPFLLDNSLFDPDILTKEEAKDQKINNLELQLQQLQFQLNQLWTQGSQIIQQKDQEIIIRNQINQEQQSQIQQLKIELENKEKELQQEKNKVSKLEQIHQESTNILERTGEKLRERKKMLQTKEQDLTNLQEQILIKQNEIDLIERKSNSISQEEVKCLKEEITKLQSQLEAKQQELVELRQQTFSYQKLIQAIAQKKQELEQIKLIIRKDNIDLLDNLCQTQTELNSLELQLQELQEEKQPSQTVNYNYSGTFNSNASMINAPTNMGNQPNFGINYQATQQALVNNSQENLITHQINQEQIRESSKAQIQLPPKS